MTADFMSVANMYSQIKRHSVDHHHLFRGRTRWVGSSAYDYTELDYENGIHLKAVFGGTEEFFEVTNNNGEVLVSKFTGPYSLFYDTSDSTYSLTITGGDGLIVTFYEEMSSIKSKETSLEEAHPELSDVLKKLDALEKRLERSEELNRQMIANVLDFLQSVKKEQENPPYPWERTNPYPWNRGNPDFPIPQTYCGFTSCDTTA